MLMTITSDATTQEKVLFVLQDYHLFEERGETESIAWVTTMDGKPATNLTFTAVKVDDSTGEITDTVSLDAKQIDKGVYRYPSHRSHQLLIVQGDA